jgi:hypothetical protein
MAQRSHRFTPNQFRNLGDLDEQTFVEWIPISKMFTAAYTRPVSEAQIERMIRSGFDRKKLGVVMLSLQHDGRFAVLDGNHRREVAKKVGETEMLSRIFIDLTYEEEAALFVDFNTINRPTALDRFRAKIEMKEPVALDIVEILARYGLRVALTGPANGAIQSIHALEQSYDEVGPVALDKIVRVIYKSWRTERRAWVTWMIQGMRQFWIRYREEVDWDRLIDRLKLTTPEQILAEAGLARLRMENPSTSVGKAFVSHYNHGMRYRRLSEWTEHPGSKKKSKDPEKEDPTSGPD